MLLKPQLENSATCGPTLRSYDVVYCDILTVSIISPQLLCFRGTITSSMSSRAIQSNLNRSLNASVCVFGAQESFNHDHESCMVVLF